MWKEIPGFPGYEASPEGQVRSARKVLEPFTDSDGHLRVNIRKGGKGMPIKLSRLIAITFVPGNGLVGYRDGHTYNCSAKNLFWRTPSEVQKGLRHAPRLHKKLSDEQVEEIRKMKGERLTRDIASKFGISPGMVSMIQTGKRRATSVSVSFSPYVGQAS